MASLALRHALKRSRAAPAQQARWLKILAADPVDPVCAQTFADNGHKLVEKKCNAQQLKELIKDYDGLVVRSGVKVTEDIISAGTKLKVIGRAGAGVDNIDTVAATKRGVIVMNTPGGNTSAAAELTFTLMMSMARQIPQAVASLKGGAWDRKKYGNGVELKGKTVGIIGLGQIGSEVARRCQALDMTTIGFDPMITEERAAAASIKKVTLDALFAASDFITLHTPLNDATRNLISAATLAKCKKGVFIVNAARGGVVHEADLLEALNAGKVAGAALDVFESEPPGPASAGLIAHPNVICTPHLGASTEEAQKKVAAEIAQQMSDAFALKGFVGVVNAPHLALAHKPALEPFVRLTEALGSLQAQILSGPVKAATVTVELAGAAFSAPDAPPAAVAKLVECALLKGMLPSLPGSELDADGVNLLNGPLLAKNASIKVAVKPAGGSGGSSAAPGSYSNMIKVSLTVEGATAGGSKEAAERVVVGSVVDGEPRVVQIDHWQNFPSFTPSDHVVFFNNVDRPGTVARITGVLSDANLNIASFLVARQHPGSPALSVVVCDSRIPSSVATKIASLDGILNVRTASFGHAFIKKSAAAEAEA